MRVYPTITQLEHAKIVKQAVEAAESATARAILSKTEYDVWELDHDGHGQELTKAIREAVERTWNEALSVTNANNCRDGILYAMRECGIPIRAAAPKSEDAK